MSITIYLVHASFADGEDEIYGAFTDRSAAEAARKQAPAGVLVGITELQLHGECQPERVIGIKGVEG